jgi:hypothetical protein
LGGVEGSRCGSRGSLRRSAAQIVLVSTESTTSRSTFSGTAEESESRWTARIASASRCSIAIRRAYGPITNFGAAVMWLVMITVGASHEQTATLIQRRGVIDVGVRVHPVDDKRILLRHALHAVLSIREGAGPVGKGGHNSDEALAAAGSYEVTPPTRPLDHLDRRSTAPSPKPTGPTRNTHRISLDASRTRAGTPRVESSLFGRQPAATRQRAHAALRNGRAGACPSEGETLGASEPAAGSRTATVGGSCPPRACVREAERLLARAWE